ncbi:MAG: MlaE family ABC transporter permease [Gemmatimonadota bacterium]
MRILDPVARVGSGAAGLLAGVGQAAGFLGRAARALADVGTWLPVTAVQARRVGVDSVPVAVFIALFTGIVLALQSSYAMTGLVPLTFVGTLVGKSIILELGPVLTGLVLAGRVGANVAAELGTMRVTEQVDALEMMAYDPASYLVVPRMLAGVLTFPIVVGFAIAAGVAAAWVTALSLLDLSTQEFVRGLRMFYRGFDVQFALMKSASFGFIVTGTGAFFGLRTERGAEGVGRAATRGVVISCVLILMVDAVWALWLV